MWDIHCSNINDNLTVLESLLTWELMLKSDKIRSYVPVLNLVISELNGYPVGVKYHHRKCCQSFTHKLHSERLSKKSQQMQLQVKETMIEYLQSEKRQILISNHLGQQQGALPIHHKKICQIYRATCFQNKCIFSDKEIKYAKRKSKFLRKLCCWTSKE